MNEFLDSSELIKNHTLIGCDEAGRGPIAGPVVGCALEISKQGGITLERLEELGVGDSKKLTSKKRLKILAELSIDLAQIIVAEPIEGDGFRFCVWEASAAEIDRVNILQASLFCMKSSFEALAREAQGPVIGIIDGNKSFDSNFLAKAVVKADARYLSVGLASIIAKEFRDEKMRRLDALYPGYELTKHAGYPTAAHRAIVAKIGPSPIHRVSFKGVREYVGIKGQ